VNNDTDQLLTLTEVAMRLKVNRETVRRLCAAGRLPWVNVGTSETRPIRRVLETTLRAYMQNERRAAIKLDMHRIRQTADAMQGVEERW
jgi:excisionase family DNA binding protein